MKRKISLVIVSVVAIVAIIGIVLVSEFKQSNYVKFQTLEYDSRDSENLVGRAGKTLASSDFDTETIVEEYTPQLSEFKLQETQESKKISELSTQILRLNNRMKKEAVATATTTLNDIISKAKERRKLLEKLIETDATSAFFLLMPISVSSRLPAELQADIEKPVKLDASIEITHYDDFENKKAIYQYFLRGGNKKYQFYPVTGQPALISGSKVRIDGYQLGDKIIAAMGSDTFKVLEAEQPDSVGEQKTLAVLLRFLDSPPEVPFTKEEAYKLIFEDQMQAFYKEASYGKVWFTGDVIGWYTVPRNLKVDGQNLWPRFDGDFDPDGILDFIKKNNINIKNYERLILLTYYPPYFGGSARVGKSPYFIDGEWHNLSEAEIKGLDGFFEQAPGFVKREFKFTKLDSVLSHELGHNLGVLHANSWECGDSKRLYGQCEHIEYGNFYDIMGYGNAALHFNAYFKDVFHWIYPTIDIVNSGTYTLHQLEKNYASAGARINPSFLNHAPYYLEYRGAIGFDSTLNNSDVAKNQNGLFINWLPRGQPYMSRLLDMSPHISNYDDWGDVVLLKGRIFVDKGRGITIGPIIKHDKNSTTFRVTLSKPRCIRNYPSVPKTYYIFYLTEPGDTTWLTVYVENADSPTCTPSTFTLSVHLPEKWTYNMAPESLFINPDGEIGVFSGTVEIPVDAQPGNYNGTIEVTNINSKLKTKKVIFYTVQ